MTTSPKGFDPTGGLDDEEAESSAPMQTSPTQTETQRIALELAEEWRRVQGGESLPRPIGPPLSPAGHAPLPSIAEQRAALGLPPLDLVPSKAGLPSLASASATGPEVHTATFPRPVVEAPAVHAAAIGIIASPDVMPAVERREPRTALSVDGHEVILPLETVLCDPKTNYARNGVAWKPDDPEVVRTANGIEGVGLKNPIGVRKLDPPIERDTPVVVWTGGLDESGERVLVTHYTHQVVDGFKRFAALQLLKHPTGRFTENDISKEIAILHNGIENIDRTELNDYQLARYFALLGRLTGWNADEVAAAVNAPSPARVAMLMMMMERLPEELLEIFRCSPTPEIRRDLVRVAKIERETKEETHQAMVDEWLRLDEQRRLMVEEKEKQKKRNAALDGPRRPTCRSMNKTEIEHFRASAYRATEWYDAMHGEWRPIDDEARAYCDAMLRRVCNSKSKPVLR